MTILAQQEEDKAAMLGELKDETKVTYQVEKAQKEKKKRKKQTRTRTN